jgi:hypothetical protein
MTQRKEHGRNEWDYENRRTPVWVMMLTSASCCRHVQQDSDISTQGTAPVYVIDIKISSSLGDVMSSTREDMIRRRHVLLRCADSSLNRLRLSSHVLMLVLTQLVCGRPKSSPARSVFNSRFLVTDVNSGDSSASRTQVLPVRRISRNSTFLRDYMAPSPTRRTFDHPSDPS